MYKNASLFCLSGFYYHSISFSSRPSSLALAPASWRSNLDHLLHWCGGPPALCHQLEIWVPFRSLSLTPFFIFFMTRVFSLFISDFMGRSMATVDRSRVQVYVCCILGLTSLEFFIPSSRGQEPLRPSTSCASYPLTAVHFRRLSIQSDSIRVRPWIHQPQRWYPPERLPTECSKNEMAKKTVWRNFSL